MNTVELERLYDLNKERKKIDKAIELLEAGTGNVFVSDSKSYVQEDSMIGGPEDVIVDVRRGVLAVLLDRRKELREELNKAGLDV